MAIPQEKYYDENRGKDLRRSGERGHWVVSQMWDIHHEIARHVLMGWKNVDIAKKLNITPQTVSNVRNSPIVQEHVEILRAARDADTVDLAKEIREIAPTALNLLKDIITGDNEGAGASLPLRAKLATDMVARVGHGVPHRVQAESVSYHLTSADIADIKNRARLARTLVNDDDVIEAEVREDL